MKFDRTGIILYVLKYDESIVFYRDVLELKILFSTDMLTCFKFGNAYLMVEVDDEMRNEPNATRIKTCLRMNVPNVKSLADKLTSKNINVNYQEHSWGTIAKFFDPDGNLCAFKDSATFEKQVNNHTSK